MNFSVQSESPPTRTELENRDSVRNAHHIPESDSEGPVLSVNALRSVVFSIAVPLISQMQVSKLFP
jgi:hypothetical protein